MFKKNCHYFLPERVILKNTCKQQLNLAGKNIDPGIWNKIQDLLLHEKYNVTSIDIKDSNIRISQVHVNLVPLLCN